ncbi:MAG: hypothetical protein Q4G66_13170 [bacterium]|nr:hypothetical protein [bacterium]
MQKYIICRFQSNTNINIIHTALSNFSARYIPLRAFVKAAGKPLFSWDNTMIRACSRLQHRVLARIFPLKSDLAYSAAWRTGAAQGPPAVRTMRHADVEKTKED